MASGFSRNRSPTLCEALKSASWIIFSKMKGHTSRKSNVIVIFFSTWLDNLNKNKGQIHLMDRRGHVCMTVKKTTAVIFSSIQCI